jgi:glycerophosphoryl diester phosphodiesterase
VKPEPAIHRRQLWRCLLSGVARVRPDVAEQMQDHPDCFQMAAWNYLFYGEHVSLDADIPWINRLMEKQAASAGDVREARAWHKTLTQFMYAVGDRFHGLIDWIPDQRIKDMIADAAPYFENHDNVADRIREPARKLICEAAEAGERVLLIGHSMGSVVAYDLLWQLSRVENSPCTVDLFLTIGSPLGMRYVQKRLLGSAPGNRTFPQGISRWENVSATGDLISVDKTVSNDFGEMIDDGLIGSIHDHCGGVFNWFRNDDGLNVHRSYGYLVNPVVGKIIADWWLGKVRSRAPVVVAHRGYPSKYPENTRIGFEKALEAGAEFVELDVQLSQELVPVLYHDSDTERISGVSGSLFDLTLPEVKELDACFPERFGDRFRGNPVMTLAEFCSLMMRWPRVGAFVEIKRESIDHFGLEKTVDSVVDVITPLAGRCVVISFHHGCLEYARAQHGVRIGWILSKWNRAMELRARALRPEFIFVNKRLLPAGKCAVWSGPWQWTVHVVDKVGRVNAYPGRGIYYVQTDRIVELLADPELVTSAGG